MVILVVCAAGAHTASADPIYMQPPTRALGGNASQHDPNNFGSPFPFQYTAFDDFVIRADASISKVQWYGSYAAPAHDPISEFMIAFWSDQSGLPGSQLRAYEIPGAANERFVEADTVTGFTGYRYRTTLAVPFAASAGTKYWVSIQPTVAFPPQWFWRDAQGGNNTSAIIIPSLSSGPRPALGDNAFELGATPEPASLILISAGVAGLMGGRWRMRHMARREQRAQSSGWARRAASKFESLITRR
jgi:hypothetical protein